MRFNPDPLRGAFLLEERHLLELDKIIDRFGSGRKTIDISLRPDRGCSFASFAEVTQTDLIERYVVSSIQGEMSSDKGCFSISIAGSGTSPARLNYSANATESEVNSFNHAVVDFSKRIRSPYFLLYKFGFDTAANIALSVLSLYFILYLVARVGLTLNLAGWAQICLGSLIANTIGQLTLYVIKRTLPPFVVLIGEGARWHNRTMTPWKFIIPRAAWQVLLVCGTMFVGWLLYQHR